MSKIHEKKRGGKGVPSSVPVRNGERNGQRTDWVKPMFHRRGERRNEEKRFRPGATKGKKKGSIQKRALEVKNKGTNGFWFGALGTPPPPSAKDLIIPGER